MERTPAPVSLAAARALQPPEGSRAAEVFRDDPVWIRFAARPIFGPQVPQAVRVHAPNEPEGRGMTPPSQFH